MLFKNLIYYFIRRKYIRYIQTVVKFLKSLIISVVRKNKARCFPLCIKIFCDHLFYDHQEFILVMLEDTLSKPYNGNSPQLTLSSY